VNRQDKEQQVQELRDVLEGATSVILTDYRGLDVASMVDLRRSLREESVGYKVVKNTLARLALEGTDKAFLAEHFRGPIAVAWSDDPVAPARQLNKFAKEHEELEIRVGYLSGNEIDLAGIQALASLPSKDELRSKFLSVLNAPAQKFVTLTSQVQRNFLLVCKQKAELAG
jgi:large subunit ribosomal protein L10